MVRTTRSSAVTSRRSAAQSPPERVGRRRSANRTRVLRRPAQVHWRYPAQAGVDRSDGRELDPVEGRRVTLEPSHRIHDHGPAQSRAPRRRSRCGLPRGPRCIRYTAGSSRPGRRSRRARSSSRTDQPRSTNWLLRPSSIASAPGRVAMTCPITMRRALLAACSNDGNGPSHSPSASRRRQHDRACNHEEGEESADDRP